MSFMGVYFYLKCNRGPSSTKEEDVMKVSDPPDHSEEVKSI